MFLIFNPWHWQGNKTGFSCLSPIEENKVSNSTDATTENWRKFWQQWLNVYEYNTEGMTKITPMHVSNTDCMKEYFPLYNVITRSCWKNAKVTAKLHAAAAVFVFLLKIPSKFHTICFDCKTMQIEIKLVVLFYTHTRTNIIRYTINGCVCVF